MVKINARQRLHLFLDATFSAAVAPERLRSALDQMHPCPANDMKTRTPERAELTERVEAMTEHFAFFDVIGWSYHDPRLEFDLPKDSVSLLCKLLKSNRNCMIDESGVLARMIESGKIRSGDYLPEGHPRAELQDSLLERSHTLWVILRKFKVADPLGGE